MKPRTKIISIIITIGLIALFLVLFRSMLSILSILSVRLVNISTPHALIISALIIAIAIITKTRKGK